MTNPAHPLLFAACGREAGYIKKNYSDLGDLWTREAFNFDIIIHSFGRDEIEDILSPAMQFFWSTAVFGDYPFLTRFIVGLAAFSPRFSELLKIEKNIYTNRKELVHWFWSEVIPAFPQFAKLAVPPKDNARPSKVEIKRGKKAAALDLYKIRNVPGDRNEEIDVLLIGPFGAGSGLGTGVRRSVSALQHAGCNLRVLECMYDNPSAPLEPIPSNLQFRGERPRATLWHFNAEYLPEVICTLPQFVNPNLNIGYFFWETEAMPTAHLLGGNMVDEIWAPSEFVRLCYDRFGVPVINVGTSVDLPKFDYFLPRSYFGLGDEFTFMFSFDSHSVIHRKNPAAVIRAFKTAFSHERDVKLIIKTQNLTTAHWGTINGRAEEMAELCADDHRIVLINRTMSLHELYSLKNAIDCYVSLHRSEGFGYGPAEAMALGKPAIMTGYSANTEFGDNGASLLVDGPLVHVLDGEYLYWTPEMVWADPNVSLAAAHMRRVYENPSFAADLGARGQQRIIAEFGRESMAAKYKKRLQDLKVM